MGHLVWQISGFKENPGAILVEWDCNTNDERCNDIQEFRLQKAFGNVILEKYLETNFIDCYRGRAGDLFSKICFLAISFLYVNFTAFQGMKFSVW